MLRSGLELDGYHLNATDGELGTCDDLLFDDARWIVRYLLARPGWLTRRRVLLSPEALGHPDWMKKTVPVNLSRQQIEDSPPIDEDKPVSRQLEEDVRKHFGWPLYWTPAGMTLGAVTSGSPPPPAAPRMEAEAADGPSPEPGDPHLRSMKEVTGYRISATDGLIGHVEDLIVDDEQWVVRYVVADTRQWLPGRKVLLAPKWFQRFDWEHGAAVVELDREAIRSSPEYDPGAPVNRDYEGRLYDYYGRPGYWTETPGPSVTWKV